MAFAHNNFLTEHCLYQDDDILVINKPAGVLTIPGKGDLIDSVLTRLQAIEPRTLLIHRLDRDTSGILVFALNKAAQSHISKQFQARTTEKFYQAILSGHLSTHLPQQGTIDIPVVYDASRPPLHIVDANEKKPAVTHWQVLQEFELNGLAVTRVEFKPITGRSHQLRVHSQYLGHAIVGDTLYADENYRRISPVLCLHAQRLRFVHPRTNEEIQFESQPAF
ncbi:MULTISPECIES: RluA family pseudouridine synthase [unclassified Acinetobacter]|uniref:RluA family pseudouridine synthase n=1 Tax=unclassified Acinetobacter TaxID=196816 RepID=UPI0035B6FA89